MEAAQAKVKRSIRSFQDLEVYQEGFRLSMEIFQLTQNFPREELYALSTQMRNASRSIPANIAEGWAKRRHELVFKRHLLDAMGSSNEMLVWLETSFGCQYLSEDRHRELVDAYGVLSKRLHQLLSHWKPLGSQRVSSTLHLLPSTL